MNRTTSLDTPLYRQPSGRWPWLACAATLLLASSAAAAPIAPLAPSMTPEKAPEIVVRFHDALAQGLTAGGVTVVPAATVRAKVKKPCARARCASPALVTLKAETAVLCAINTAGKNYRFELQLVSKTGALANVSGRCDICTLMEALKTTRDLATKLAHKVHGLKPAAPVKKPTEATKPKTPPTTKKDPAKTPPVAKKAVKTAPRNWPLWPALAAAGVGVLGLAVGIPLVSMDGDPTNCRGEARPDGRNCADVYSTSGAGWAMTTMGLAGLATAGVLFYLYFTSDKRERASKVSAWQRSQRLLTIAPADGGFFLGASGTF